MRLDLHIHTRPYSLCSTIEPENLIQEARRAGLDGFCLTEHHRRRNSGEMEGLISPGGMRIFQGNEVFTSHGEILIFGYAKEVKKGAGLKDLRKEVEAEGGFMIVAHPFKEYLFLNREGVYSYLAQACRREIFHFVDGIEIHNSRVSELENEMARLVSQRLSLLGVAGSDAHYPHEIGRCVTVLEKDVSTEKELIEELRAGRFTVESQNRPQEDLERPAIPQI